MKILVIPDAHDEPGVPQDRFEWAGKLAVQERPDHIVSLGDWTDLISLCSYDEGTAKAEGNRLDDDLKSCRASVERFMKPIRQLQARQKKRSEKLYKPKMHICLGNHENRIFKLMNNNPKLSGLFSSDDFGFKSAGFNVVPFLKPLEIGGIVFKHYFTSGIMGKPMSGEFPAKNMVRKNLTSCVAGHSHTMDYARIPNGLGDVFFGLIAGCYFEHDMTYTPENQRYWRGLVMLEEVKKGSAEVIFWPLKKIKDTFQTVKKTSSYLPLSKSRGKKSKYLTKTSQN